MRLTWKDRKQEESYLSQLEQILVQKIRTQENSEMEAMAAQLREKEELSQLSREINEELCRIEQLVDELEKE